MNTYHSAKDLLVASPKATEGAERVKVMITVTPMIQLLCKAIWKSTFTKLDATERHYLLDVGRGMYKTAEIARLKLAAKRSANPTHLPALVTAIIGSAAADREAIPLERARFRKTKEVSEATIAEAKHDFRQSKESFDAMIAEAKDAQHAWGDWVVSLEAERASRYGAGVSA